MSTMGTIRILTQNIELLIVLMYIGEKLKTVKKGSPKIPSSRRPINPYFLSTLNGLISVISLLNGKDVI